MIGNVYVMVQGLLSCGLRGAPKDGSAWTAAIAVPVCSAAVPGRQSEGISAPPFASEATTAVGPVALGSGLAGRFLRLDPFTS